MRPSLKETDDQERSAELLLFKHFEAIPNLLLNST